MKKSTFWLILAIVWTIDVIWLVSRFFDIHIVVRNKDGALVKEIEREGKKPALPDIVNVALAGLLADLNWFHFFKARRGETLAAKYEQAADQQ